MSALCVGRWPFYFCRGDLHAARAWTGESCTGRSVTRRRRGPAGKERTSWASGRLRPADPARPEPGAWEARSGARGAVVGAGVRSVSRASVPGVGGVEGLSPR